MATHLDAERRNDYLAILRYLFRKYVEESGKELSSLDQFSTSTEHFNLWLIHKASQRDLLPDNIHELPELQNIDPASILEFLTHFDDDGGLTLVMGFTRWFWPLITVPRRMLGDGVEIEQVIANFAVVLKGKGPAEDRTVNICCRNEYDDRLGDLLEPQVIYEWFRCFRSAVLVMLKEGLEFLPRRLGKHFENHYDDNGDVVIEQR